MENKLITQSIDSLDNTEWEKLRPWVKGRKVAVLISARFTMAMMRIGKNTINPNFLMNFSLFRDGLTQFCEADTVAIHFFTAIFPNKPYRLIDWMTYKGGYEIHKKVQRTRESKDGTASMVPVRFKTEMAFAAARILDDYDIFLILELDADIGDLYKLISLQGKTVIAGELTQTARNFDYHSGTGANLTINFSEPSMLATFMRPSIDDYESGDPIDEMGSDAPKIKKRAYVAADDEGDDTEDDDERLMAMLRKSTGNYAKA